jgi:pseudaminic acid synthase
MKETFIQISGRRIGKGYPVFIIAELSANHLQDFKLAVKTIREMKKAGADAVKLQTYTPDTITIDCDNRYFRINQGTLWDGKTLHQLYRQAYMPWEWQPKLKKIAEGLGLICFSSPFDKTAVDFLKKMGTPAYKVASFEITDIPLIEYIASQQKPVIISTGIAERGDIQQALDACARMGNKNIALLKCTSAYPSPLDKVNLNAIPVLQKMFKPAVIGLSDHTLGIAVPAAAVALGARIIEKHFILERSLGGPDAKFSLEPAEFSDMVKSIREVEKALGSRSLALSKEVAKSRNFARSLFAVADIAKGEILTEENIRSIRPGNGLSPKMFQRVIGKRARRHIRRGTPLRRELIY